MLELVGRLRGRRRRWWLVLVGVVGVVALGDAASLAGQEEGGDRWWRLLLLLLLLLLMLMLMLMLVLVLVLMLVLVLVLVLVLRASDVSPWVPSSSSSEKRFGLKLGSGPVRHTFIRTDFNSHVRLSCVQVHHWKVPLIVPFRALY
jgi:hypothetical protein